MAYSPSKGREARCSFISRTDVPKANHAGVWEPLTNSKLTKVVVQRHEHPILGECASENRIVTGVHRPLTDSIHFVTCAAEIIGSRIPHSGVEQQPHCGSLAYLGMNRSFRTMLKAYARHA
jgi:hypothetical protein